MIPKIAKIRDSDRGVSPVIGVILMVAITVILAAVIGTFVLGLGDGLEQAPQAQLNADSESADYINVTHDGGDAIPVDELQISFDGESTDFSDTENSLDDEFDVGSTARYESDQNGAPDFGNDTAVEVRVIHTPSDSVIMEETVDVPDNS